MVEEFDPKRPDAEGARFVAVDTLGAGRGDTVVLSQPDLLTVEQAGNKPGVPRNIQSFGQGKCRTQAACLLDDL